MSKNELTVTRFKSNSSETQVEDGDNTYVRERWESRWEFLLSCIGFSVGIGNVWRFPYLAYENGGGAFLVPYLIMLLLAGRPLYFMELCLGQFVGRGPMCVWNCVPIAKGVGLSMIAACLAVCIYYNVIISYCLYYMVSVFTHGLPWTRCDPEWANNTNCVVRNSNLSSFSAGVKISSQVFWEHKVLDTTDSIDNLGGIKWDLALSLFFCWVVTVLCLVRGVRSSGKVVYFAATFPYLILISLMVIGFTRPGAWEGIKFYLTPSWSKLLTSQVWIAAASQMFFSLGITLGVLIMYSSYNDFSHNVYQDAMIVSCMDTFTSIVAGMVIFSGLGAMAHELGVDIKDVVKGGPGLAFVVYPEALSRLPFAHLWSILFFFMLFVLGMDTEFALLESLMTSLADEFFIVRKHKLKFCAALGFLCFLCGLPCVTRGGQFVLEIFDYHGGSLPLVYIAMAECMVLIWIYGYENFAGDIKFMLNRTMGTYWRITWFYTAPCVLFFMGISAFISHEPMKLGSYLFPQWANRLGWSFSIFMLLLTPGYAIFKVVKEKDDKGWIETVKLLAKPNENWGPQDSDRRLEWRSIQMTAGYGTT